MTGSGRLTRLEAAVTSFVQSSTEFQTEIMHLVRTHNAALSNHSAILEHHASVSNGSTRWSNDWTRW